MIAKDPVASGIVVNYYGASTFEAESPLGRAVRISQATLYPLDGEIQLIVAPDAPEIFTLHLRIPSWSRTTRILVNGQSLSMPAVRGTYFALTREWRAGDTIDLTLAMSPHL